MDSCLTPAYYTNFSVIFYMAGFLSDSQITKISGVFETLHTTFARDVTIYKNPKKTVVSTSPRYSPIYGRRDTGSTSSVTYETVSGVFPARIYYISSDEQYLGSDGQNKIILPAGSAKITVKKNGYEFIKEARRVELDGQRFSIKSDGTPQGFTGNQFYTFLLTPIDEGE